MTGRYTLSPEAQRDIEQIREYYLNEAGAPVARHVLAQITKALRFLAGTPGAGHRRMILPSRTCGSGQCCPI
ncbi:MULTISPECIES: type II toxin-antitoxin system RelE/ParE family toxin [unclassified Novosphingobium]|uniref:type II toxin-antitoxin system RelE/ParE family toxin n=1 Tax=Novosphingobium sp. AAP1 TaxID=1523413 RepID=UPI0009EC4F21